MPTWEEWEKLVDDARKGNTESLRLLLGESQGIIHRVIKDITGKLSKSDLDEILSEIYIRIIKRVPSLRNQRAYVDYLRRTTRSCCLDYLRGEKSRQNIEISLEEMDESRARSLGKEAHQLISLADIKGFAINSVSAFQKESSKYIESEYEAQVDNKLSDIVEALNEVKKEKKFVRIYKRMSPVHEHILAQTVIDKEEFDYPEAEKKLRAIIEFTERRRLDTELRFLRAMAAFELGHLKMNQGLVEGDEGSISWYSKAGQLWRFLEDKQNEYYTVQQIGVSYHIQGDDTKAQEIYNGILGEIRGKKTFKGIKSNVWRDLSNACLAQGNIQGSDKCVDKSLLLAEDIGGECLSYSQLQKAKVYFEKGRYKRSYYDKAHAMIIKSTKDTPPYRYLDHVKANILLFDLYMETREREEALDLVPDIEEKCRTYFFHHQLQKLQNRLIKYRLA